MHDAVEYELIRTIKDLQAFVPQCGEAFGSRIHMQLDFSGLSGWCHGGINLRMSICLGKSRGIEAGYAAGRICRRAGRAGRCRDDRYAARRRSLQTKLAHGTSSNLDREGNEHCDRG